MKEISDQSQRREAVTTSTHAFVWASAGTGKTHTLTLRALYLLLHPPTPELFRTRERSARLQAARAIIQSIALTTFTRKAAAEMQTRLYSYLDTIVCARQPARLWQSELVRMDPLFREIVESTIEQAGTDYEGLRRGAEALAELASELRISTLHSFAAAIVRRHPVETKLPPGVHFAREDEDDLSGLEEQLLERWWQTQVFRNSWLREQVAEVLDVLAIDQLRLWLKTVYRHPWIVSELGSFGLPPTQLSQELIGSLTAVIQSLERPAGAKIKRVRDRLLQAVEEIESNRPGGWLRLCRLAEQEKNYLFTQGSPPRQIQRSLQALSPSQQRWFENYQGLYRVALGAALETEYPQAWSCWKRLLNHFKRWARRAAVTELGVVTFDEMIDLAVELLENDTPVRLHEKQRLRALLVDEFQDTDRTQLRLLKALLSCSAEESHEVLGFFVGDLKQSIYRFRGADVAAIRRFHRQFADWTHLPSRDFRLTTSFRSRPALAEFANRFFSQTLPLASEEEQLRSFSKSVAPAPRWLHCAQENSGQSACSTQARQETADQVVAVIRDYLSTMADARHSDILVLTETNRELDLVLSHLHRASIPVISGGAKNFLKNHEVLDVLNLLISLHNPWDTLATAAVLRSPLVLLSDVQIHRLLSQLPASKIVHSSDPFPEWLPKPVTHRLDRLRELARLRLQMDQKEWIGEVSGFIPKAAYLSSLDHEGRVLARIQRVLKTFSEELQRALYPPLAWLLNQRQRAAGADRWDADLGEDVSLSDESIDAVRLMTVHKAKGLEARLVIVFSWSSLLSEKPRWRNGDSSAVYLNSTADGQIRRGFCLPWGRLQLLSSEYESACRLEEEQAIEESIRLAYVAGTRACERLILMTPMWRGLKLFDPVESLIEQCKTDKGVKWLEFSEESCVQPQLVTAAARAHQVDLGSYRALWEDRYQQLTTTQPRLLSPSVNEADLDDDGPKSIHFGRGRQVGQLVHRYLELYLREDSFSAENLLRLAREFARPAPEALLYPAGRILRAFFEGRSVDSSGSAYLERVRQSRVLARELPVYLRVNAQPWQGILDLILEEKGLVRGIDFKTTAPLDPLPTTYRQQRLVYLEAIRRLFPSRQVDFEFWWLGLAPVSRSPEQGLLFPDTVVVS